MKKSQKIIAYISFIFIIVLIGIGLSHREPFTKDFNILLILEAYFVFILGYTYWKHGRAK